MSGFLYYIPGADRRTVGTKLHENGLAYALGDGHTPCEVSPGPDEGSGLVLGATSFAPDSAIRYYPDRQTWRKIPKSDAWAGFYNSTTDAACRPRPEDLARKEMLPGHPVRLGDENDWLVPVARGMTDEDERIRGYNALPTATALDDSGDWAFGTVIKRYEHLWGIATRWWDSLMGGFGDDTETPDQSNRIEFDFAGSHDAALAALVANYHIGKIEVVMLGLFSQMSVVQVLNALVDWPKFLTLLKKKQERDEAASNGSTSADGPPAT